jgi:hypothetical protein
MYTSRESTNYRWYYPSATSISNKTSAKTSTSTTMVLLAEQTLKNIINPESRFRFQYLTKCAVFSDSQVYLNDVAVGTAHLNYVGAYTTWTEDIDIELRRGDRVQVYARTTNPANSVFVKELEIMGDWSYFEDTTA